MAALCFSAASASELEYVSDSETTYGTDYETADEIGTACIMDPSSYYRAEGCPTMTEEDSFCEWLEFLGGEPCPRNFLWAAEQKASEEMFLMEEAEDDEQPPLHSIPSSRLSPVARTAVQLAVVSPTLRRGPSQLEESATIELSHLEQLHLRQAIFTFFLRLGISIEELTPENIRTTKSLQVDEGGMASIAVAIPVSQTSSNRHVWWCTRLSANDDTPMREDSPPPDQPATKLIMSPVTICHLPASNEDRAITPTRLRFDRHREKRHLVRALRQIGSDLEGGRDAAACESVLKVLLGKAKKKSTTVVHRYGSVEVRDSSGQSYHSRQRSLFFSCLFRWAQGNVASSKTLPACYVLARLAYPEELVAGIRHRIICEEIIWKLIAFAQDGKISLHKELAVGDVDLDHLVNKGAGGRVFLGHQKDFRPQPLLRPRPVLPQAKHRVRLASKVKRRISSLSTNSTSAKGAPKYMSSPDVFHASSSLAKVGPLGGPSDVTSVAIKSTHEDYVGFNKHEFFFEVALMSAHVHPHILPCYGAHVSGPSFFHTSPFQARGSLESVLAEVYEPFPWKLRLRILLVVAEVFDFLHYHKIMHRDLKSANILLGETDDAIFVTDFGCSRFFDKTYDSSPLESRIGTEGWMAPEMFEMGHKYTSKVDVYSFAVVISEMLTSQLPFAQFAGGRVDIPDRVAQGERPILKLPKLGFGSSGEEVQCPPAVEEELIGLAERCWAPNPAKRPSFAKIVPVLSRLYDLL